MSYFDASPSIAFPSTMDPIPPQPRPLPETPLPVEIAVQYTPQALGSKLDITSIAVYGAGIALTAAGAFMAFNGNMKFGSIAMAAGAGTVLGWSVFQGMKREGRTFAQWYAGDAIGNTVGLLGVGTIAVGTMSLLGKTNMIGRDSTLKLLGVGAIIVTGVAAWKAYRHAKYGRDIRDVNKDPLISIDCPSTAVGTGVANLTVTTPDGRPWHGVEIWAATKKWYQSCATPPPANEFQFIGVTDARGKLSVSQFWCSYYKAHDPNAPPNSGWSNAILCNN